MVETSTIIIIVVAVLVVGGIAALAFFTAPKEFEPTPQPEPSPPPENGGDSSPPDEDIAAIQQRYNNYVTDCGNQFQGCRRQGSARFCLESYRNCLVNAPPSGGSPMEKQANCQLNLVNCSLTSSPTQIPNCTLEFNRCLRRN